MGDEAGFDPCECVFSHEAAMQRLLTLVSGEGEGGSGGGEGLVEVVRR